MRCHFGKPASSIRTWIDFFRATPSPSYAIHCQSLAALLDPPTDEGVDIGPHPVRYGADLAPVVAELQAAGAASLRAIAVGLNGGAWNATQNARTGAAVEPRGTLPAGRTKLRRRCSANSKPRSLRPGKAAWLSKGYCEAFLFLASARDLSEPWPRQHPGCRSEPPCPLENERRVRQSYL
jgi:hypothetical protein